MPTCSPYFDPNSGELQVKITFPAQYLLHLMRTFEIPLTSQPEEEAFGITFGHVFSNQLADLLEEDNAQVVIAAVEETQSVLEDRANDPNTQMADMLIDCCPGCGERIWNCFGIDTNCVLTTASE